MSSTYSLFSLPSSYSTALVPSSFISFTTNTLFIASSGILSIGIFSGTSVLVAVTSALSLASATTAGDRAKDMQRPASNNFLFMVFLLIHHLFFYT